PRLAQGGRPSRSGTSAGNREVGMSTSMNMNAGAPRPGKDLGGAMTALTLRLQDEVFAIDAESVREILDVVPITEGPKAKALGGGLINVGGRIVPLADLRLLFGMDRPPPDVNTRIVVIEVDLDGEPTIVAILADRVHDVSEIEAATIEQAPRIGMRWRPEYV